jgi:hypothetical protein
VALSRYMSIIDWHDVIIVRMEILNRLANISRKLLVNLQYQCHSIKLSNQNCLNFSIPGFQYVLHVEPWFFWCFWYVWCPFIFSLITYPVHNALLIKSDICCITYHVLHAKISNIPNLEVRYFTFRSVLQSSKTIEFTMY